MGHVTSSWGDAIAPAAPGWAILVHGGAGDVAPERVPRHVEGCRAAVAAGAEILRAGGTALDAAQRAVEVLEDDPHFNAGRGACLNDAGAIELDASVMEGTRLRAGAVGALPPFLHPIAIARKVLEEGRHVLYADRGAEAFALANGFARAGDDELVTEHARARLANVLAGRAGASWAGGGTVGAVARDARGATAAATSTGGLVGKRPGRIGDTGVIGAGTYADDAAGACSNTGDGDAILRVCLAKAIVDGLRGAGAGDTPAAVAARALELLAERAGGRGGTILVDATGRVALARSSRMMSWAAANAARETSGS
jgi:beta-aspartyl-peptidase (threonine type)